MKNILLIAAMMLMHSGSVAQDFWQQTNGPKAHQGNGNSIFSLLATDDGNLFAGTWEGIFRSHNAGDDWYLCEDGDIVLSFAINSRGVIFGGKWGAWLYRSLDNGWTWMKSDSGILTTYPVFAVTTNKRGDVFAGMNVDSGRGGIYKSTDDGVSWELLVDSLGIFSLAVDCNGYIYAGAYVSSQTSYGVYRSTDEGTTWHRVGSTQITRTQVRALAVAASSLEGGCVVYAGTETGVYKSTDQGVTWSKTNLNGARSLVINSAGDVFARDDVSIHRSTNGGQSWDEISSGLDSVLISCLAVGRDGRLFAGISGVGTERDTIGVFRSVRSTTDVQSSTENSSSFILEQNYPNPFSRATTIQVKGNGLFEVRDMLGRVVYQTKVTNTIAQLSFDGSNLPNGIYYYSLRDGSVIQSRSMMIVK